jgi:hypothetical protein
LNSGLITIFTALEPCLSYSIRGDRWAKKLKLVLETRKCLHLYYLHPSFGLMHVRVQSWFPFTVDICFKDGASLAKYYSHFLHHAIRSFASPDVLRFLGKRVHETTGKVAANFHGQLTTSLKHRAEGIRIRHSLNGNWLKMYDKEGQVLRVETTINHPEQFKVYRATESDPEQKLCWHRLRLGVADLWRRAQICEAANRRYLEALASVTGKSPLHQEALGVCRATSKVQQRRQAAAITRRLALLRAHGVLRKVGGTHRYQLSPRGRRVLTALLAARNADVDQLTKIAA